MMKGCMSGVFLIMCLNPKEYWDLGRATGLKA